MKIILLSHCFFFLLCLVQNYMQVILKYFILTVGTERLYGKADWEIPFLQPKTYFKLVLTTINPKKYQLKVRVKVVQSILMKQSA